MTIDICTFCHHRDVHKLHAEGALENLIQSHRFNFDNVIVVHQNIRGTEYRLFDLSCRIVESEDYPDIFDRFSIDLNDFEGIRNCHGPDWKHWWPNHVINHAIGTLESKSDYIVFSDSDCYIKEHQDGQSWIEIGINILEKYDQVFMVGPGDGAQMFEAKTTEGYRLTRNVSQQLFLVNRQRLLDMNWDLEWDGKFIAPGGPFQEFYWLLEGRIWRWLERYGLWRCILPDKISRYWHLQW